VYIEFLVIQKCTIRGESPYEIRPVFFLMKKGLLDTNNLWGSVESIAKGKQMEEGKDGVERYN